MIYALLFEARGTPRAKARPRFVKGRVVTTANPKEKLWRSTVDRAVKLAVANRGDRAPIFTGPVRVRMVFTFAAPPSDPGRRGPHTHKPDADNVAKLVADAMERGGIYRNDSQAAQLPVEKWWGKRPGVVVTVEPIENEGRAGPNSVELDAPGWLSG